MNNLKRLMREFAILGMEPEALDAENGLEFDPTAVSDPTAEVAPEEEYELDADGNPILDAEGNPIPKVKPEVAGACTCDDNTLPAVEEPPIGAMPSLPPPASAFPVEPEDEFDFNL